MQDMKITSDIYPIVNLITRKEQMLLETVNYRMLSGGKC